MKSSPLTLTLTAIILAGLGNRLAAAVEEVVQSPTILFPSIQNMTQSCGSCWCIISNDAAECPDADEGIRESFPEPAATLYASFVATNQVTLASENGDANCYPFGNSIPPTDVYPESAWPACQLPNNNTRQELSSAVCAHVFEDANTNFSSIDECQNRRYSIQTFDSPEVVPSSASIVHYGSCGVCSSAQDLAVMMRFNDKLVEIGIKCGTAYFLAGGFPLDQLISCYLTETAYTENDLSSTAMTPECASIWAHNTATNAFICGDVCGGTYEPPFNGDPPICELIPCILCARNQFDNAFTALAGLASYQTKAGIVDPLIALPCDDYVSVIHDPCPGVDILTGVGTAASAEPGVTPAPTTTSGSAAQASRSPSSEWLLWSLLALTLVI